MTVSNSQLLIGIYDSGKTFANFERNIKYILTQKIPLHELSFDSMVTIEVKRIDFHFPKREYPFLVQRSNLIGFS